MVPSSCPIKPPRPRLHFPSPPSAFDAAGLLQPLAGVVRVRRRLSSIPARRATPRGRDRAHPRYLARADPLDASPPLLGFLIERSKHHPKTPSSPAIGNISDHELPSLQDKSELVTTSIFSATSPRSSPSPSRAEGIAGATNRSTPPPSSPSSARSAPPR